MTLEKKKNIKKELFDFLMLLIGCVCTSLSFNLFLLPNNIVVGFSGLSIVANSLFGIRPSLFLIISYSILAILSLKFLGFKSTRRTILGSILYPLFVELTTYVTPYIDLSNIEGIVLILCGAILSGFGSGLVYKVNYSTGGSDVVNQLLNKLLKQPIGKCMLITNGIIISIGFAVFGLRTVIYSILVVYIISSVTDRVMIGISESKTFRIITQNETDVKKFLLTKLSHGVTVIEARGGYTGDNIKMIRCIVPTREYITVKEGVLEIDNDAMIMVSDVYEVLGNKWGVIWVLYK